MKDMYYCIVKNIKLALFLELRKYCQENQTHTLQWLKNTTILH